MRHNRYEEDDIAPILGSSRARRDAQREYLDLSDEIREDDEDPRSPSYKPPVE